jgi:hypothetical protein
MFWSYDHRQGEKYLNLGRLHPVARVTSYDVGFNPSTLSGVGGENIRHSLSKLNKLNLCKQLLILILNYTNAT